MSIAFPGLAIYRTEDNIQLGLRVKGDEYLHWLEDTTGNPVVIQDGKPVYADWSSEKQKFILAEAVTKASRRRHLTPKRRKPSGGEATRIRMRAEAEMPIIESNVGPQSAPVADVDDDAESLARARSSPLIAVNASGIPKKAVKRPLMIIYVRFADSVGASIPDSYLEEITFDKTKVGTLAHYFDLQFDGAVEFVNLGIYHVTLPTNGKAFGGGSTSRTDVWLPVIEDLFTNQGVDFRAFGTTHPDTYGYADNRIDRSTCTPIIITHGQEEAAGVTGSGSVWGHAYRNGTGILIADDGHPTSFIGAKYHLKNAAMFGGFHGGNYFNLGIIAHECGHGLFDLPDLYDTATGAGNDNVMGFGIWSLMAYNWTYTSAKPQMGSTPPNLDGYSIWRFNHKLAKAITSSGPQVLESPFRPHVIRMSGVSDESFIVQSRTNTMYDEGPYEFMKRNYGRGHQPGVLIAHYNPGSSTEGNLNANDMVATVVEAHGGVQNLRRDISTPGSGANYGDAGDLFGTATKQEFGDSVSDPNNKLIYEHAGRLGLFDMTSIIGNSDGTGSYNIQFNPSGGTDPGWDELPDDPEAPENQYQPSDDDDDIDLTDPYRHAVRHGTGVLLEFTRPIPYPYSVLQIYPIAGSAVSRRTGDLTVATENHVFTARLVIHRLVSTYKGHRIGDGIDIYVGKVLCGIPKVVSVKFFNEDDNLAQLRDIGVEIVPSHEYPYYDLADLSLDGLSWGKSIFYNGSQLLSIKSGAAETLCTFDFFAKVETATTVSDPKPVQVRITYTRILP